VLIHNLGVFKSMTLVLSAMQRPVRGTLSKEFLVVNISKNNYDDGLCTCMIPPRYPVGVPPWYRLEITTWRKR
jgi:hypothetical protein